MDVPASILGQAFSEEKPSEQAAFLNAAGAGFIKYGDDVADSQAKCAAMDLTEPAKDMIRYFYRWIDRFPSKATGGET